MLHALVAAWMFIVPQPAGAIHLLVESNAEILIDGRSAGLSSDAAGGMIIDFVPVGPHDIIIITDGGGRTSFKVQVHDGELSTIQVSSLGLRATLGSQRPSKSSIQVEVPDHPDVPDSWKAAIRSAQFSGIHTEELARAGERRVTATFSAPDWAALVAFLHNLREADGVEDVEVVRYASIYSGVEVRVVITFRNVGTAFRPSSAG